MNRRERRAAALKPGGSSSSGPNISASVAAFLKAALEHFSARRYLEAQLCCRQALSNDANCTEALHLMGQLAACENQHDVAIGYLASAIRHDPKPEYLVNLGKVLRRAGRLEEALKTFDKAAQLKPETTAPWKNLGELLVELKRPAEAVLCYQRVLQLDAGDTAAASACGIALHGLGRYEDALFCFNLHVGLMPNQPVPLYLRGRALLDLKRYDEALTDLERALALDPDHADCSNSIGLALQALGRHDAALTAFDRALGLRPDLLEALNNKSGSLGHFRRFDEALGLLDRVLSRDPSHVPALTNKALWLTETHRFDEALAAYERVMSVDPANADAEWNLSFLHLLVGNFEAGWLAREARWKSQQRSTTSYPEFAQPRWLGTDPIAGKTVLIYAEEGLGDTIQLARYIPMVAAQGARVILVAASPLCAMLSKMTGVDQCLAKPLSEQPAFDFHCPISSLPLIFKTRLDTIPPGKCYLPALPANIVETWCARLGSFKGPKIGLVWSGSAGHKNDHNRSISLAGFAPLLECAATFVSLQKELRPVDQEVLRRTANIVDLTCHLTDFVETAALISCLDLVITVDTSVAHLAGALGKRTWILLPYTPDYRWLLDRNDSPWYPGVRLFRQSADRSYSEVLSRVQDELKAFVIASSS